MPAYEVPLEGPSGEELEERAATFGMRWLACAVVRDGQLPFGDDPEPVCPIWPTGHHFDQHVFGRRPKCRCSVEQPEDDVDEVLDRAFDRVVNDPLRAGE